MAALGGDRHPPAPPARAAASASSALADAALAGALGGGCRRQVCQAAQPPWYSSSLTAAGKAPLFLGKALSVKNVVATGLHLQTMAWTWFELRKLSLYLCTPDPHSLQQTSRAPRGSREGHRGCRANTRGRAVAGSGHRRSEAQGRRAGMGSRGRTCTGTCKRSG